MSATTGSAGSVGGGRFFASGVWGAIASPSALVLRSSSSDKIERGKGIYQERRWLMIVKSLLWCAKLLLGGWRGKLMRWSPMMRRSQLSGVWMLSLKQPNRRALWSNAAKSSAFCCAKTYIGGVRIARALLATKTLSQKNGGRHSLQPAARRVDDRLRR
jgi:hypothetical protein